MSGAAGGFVVVSPPLDDDAFGLIIVAMAPRAELGGFRSTRTIIL